MLMNWLRDEEGQAMVEYGLIIALIAIVVIGALIILGPKIAELFDRAATELESASNWSPSGGQ
ncbi:MAG TPA: Flp family type IVb pilin [Clostridiales bacterium]|nr:Flp family type IVb pilin [Clostridiales bacterium]HXK82896.1 Flp family type IVb pilin [Clostridiales bacterium]